MLFYSKHQYLRVGLTCQCKYSGNAEDTWEREGFVSGSWSGGMCTFECNIADVRWILSQDPTCRPETCSQTGGSESGRCSGSRSWAARTGTSGTTSCSPCRSRTWESRRSSSCAAPSRSGATTPWSARCGSPGCRGTSWRTGRCRRNGPVRAPSPSRRIPGGGSARSDTLSLCLPWCALRVGFPLCRWTFSATHSPSSPSPSYSSPVVFRLFSSSSGTKEAPQVSVSLPPQSDNIVKALLIIMSSSSGGKVLSTLTEGGTLRWTLPNGLISVIDLSGEVLRDGAPHYCSEEEHLPQNNEPSWN